jgi:ferredoxin--NADP+ reductase
MKLEKDALSGGKVYKPSEPFRAKVLVNRPLTSGEEEVRHVVIDIRESDLRYLEGQSLGVLAPGVQENGKPHKLRLYSIASPRGGDADHPGTVSLCVKRLIEKKEDGSIYQGIASNYICDLKPGDDVLVTGPVGMHFLLPADDRTNIIMVATGTGIAPFKSFLDHIFRERATPWRGTLALFFGAKFKNELIYCNEMDASLRQFESRPHFQHVCAISREEMNAEGGRMYVQHRIDENYDSIRSLLAEDNFALYICGLKGMEKGIEDVFRARLGEEEWEHKKQLYRKDGRWIVEVY